MKPTFLKDAAQAGLYHVPATRRRQLQELAGRAHLHLLAADVSDCNGLAETLGELGQACHFPIWYGANLDALNDCLTDPDWQPGHGLLLWIDGLDTLRHKDPEAFARLLEVLADAARTRSSELHPLWILITAPARGLASLPDA